MTANTFRAKFTEQIKDTVRAYKHHLQVEEEKFQALVMPLFELLRFAGSELAKMGNDDFAIEKSLPARDTQNFLSFSFRFDRPVDSADFAVKWEVRGIDEQDPDTGEHFMILHPVEYADSFSELPGASMEGNHTLFSLETGPEQLAAAFEPVLLEFYK